MVRCVPGVHGELQLNVTREAGRQAVRVYQLEESTVAAPRVVPPRVKHQSPGPSGTRFFSDFQPQEGDIGWGVGDWGRRGGRERQVGGGGRGEFYRSLAGGKVDRSGGGGYFRGVGGGYAFVACLRHLTIDPVALSRRSIDASGGGGVTGMLQVPARDRFFLFFIDAIGQSQGQRRVFGVIHKNIVVRALRQR